MLSLRAVLQLICFVALAASTASASQWMSHGELRKTFAGHAIEGHYADGRTFTESYRPDRRLEYIEGGRVQTGYWEIVAGTFCTIYDGAGDGGCFRVRMLSANCFEFYFQARDEKSAADLKRRGRPSWTARAWRTGAVSTCQERPSV